MVQDYAVRIEGLVPLLHNAYPLGTEKKKVRGTVFNADEEIKKCFYRTNEGKIYQPSEHIEGALIKAGSSKTVPGKGKKTYKDLMKTNIVIFPREIPFPNGSKYITDVRLCVIPATRGRVPVARPRWDKWGFDFTIRVKDESLLDGETLRELLEIAGREQGIGTYRPKYGLFEVTKFEPAKQRMK